QNRRPIQMQNPARNAAVDAAMTQIAAELNIFDIEPLLDPNAPERDDTSVTLHQLIAFGPHRLRIESLLARLTGPKERPNFPPAFEPHPGEVLGTLAASGAPLDAVYTVGGQSWRLRD